MIAGWDISGEIAPMGIPMDLTNDVVNIESVFVAITRSNVGPDLCRNMASLNNIT